jgi:hypothetical protein
MLTCIINTNLTNKHSSLIKGHSTKCGHDGFCVKCPTLNTTWLEWRKYKKPATLNYGHFLKTSVHLTSSKAAGFAQQLGRFLTYFHLAALHKNFVVIGAANEALQSSLTLHFQQAAKIVATLLDCFSSSVRRSLNSG